MVLEQGPCLVSLMCHTIGPTDTQDVCQCVAATALSAFVTFVSSNCFRFNAAGKRPTSIRAGDERDDLGVN